MITSNQVRFEPVKGYSKPVVRVFDKETGRVLWTLSFTERGFPFNRPSDANLDLCMDAWTAWKAAHHPSRDR